MCVCTGFYYTTTFNCKINYTYGMFVVYFVCTYVMNGNAGSSQQHAYATNTLSWTCVLSDVDNLSHVNKAGDHATSSSPSPTAAERKHSAFSC